MLSCVYLKICFIILLIFIDLIAGKLSCRSKCCRRLLPLHQILAVLQFYATGTFQSVCGNVLRISQLSVSRAIHDVSLAFCQISQDHIHFSENLLEVLSNNNFIKMI